MLPGLTLPVACCATIPRGGSEGAAALPKLLLSLTAWLTELTGE